MAQYILHHIAHIRQNVAGCSRSKFIIVIENNLAQMGRIMRDVLIDKLHESRRSMATELILHRRGMMEGISADIQLEFYEDPEITQTEELTRATKRAATTMSAQPASHKIGFYTSGVRKEEMVHEFTNRLRAGLVQFHSQFFTTRIDSYTKDTVRDLMRRQFLSFMAQEIVQNGPNGSNGKRKRVFTDNKEPTVVLRYSGKGGPGQFDDAVMVTLFTLLSAIIRKRHASFMAHLNR